MRNYRTVFTCFLATLLAVLVAGCGQETVTIPGVVSVTPAQGATNVAVNATISATFSQKMSATSINGTTFTLAGPGGTAVAGTTVTLDATGKIATLVGATLVPSTTYTATITTGAATPGGAELIGNYTWSFTTMAQGIPAVQSVTPMQGTASVLVNAPITATFNMAMSSASLNTAFTVAGPGGVALTGTTVTLDSTGMIATLVGATLAYGTTYTATITTGAMDPAGTPLVANYIWSFTTIAAIPPVVPSVMSVTPAQGAANVSVNTLITATFSTAMNTGSISNTTFTVLAPGNVAVTGAVTLSADGMVATFMPTGGALANSTTYTATITTGAMSTASVPLVGAYVWTFTTITPQPAVVATVPANTATGVPVAQVLSARFNEAMNCATLKSPATTFTLTGPGATPVTGTIACTGAVASFTPNADLAFNTVYTAMISTGAQDPAGTPLAGVFTWTFSTIAAPPLPPTVISTVPRNLAVNVPVNQALTATFSEAMDAETINSATFLLVQTSVPGTPINGVITYVAAGSVAKFVPNAPLTPSTNYTATITSDAMDLNDDAGVTTFTWTFTTAAGPITIPPTVISTVPVTSPEDMTVPLNQAVSAVFSEAMDPATISSANFMLTGPGATLVPGLVAYAAVGDTLVFIPSSDLIANTTYTATITTGVQDLAGDPMASKYVWTFMTGTAVVAVSPELVSTNPASAATNVPLNQAVSAVFSEAMDPLTLTTTTFQLKQGGNLIQATITYDAVNFIATLTPKLPLTASTTYTATVTDGATDLAGNPLGNTGVPNPWTFTTGAAVVPPPIVLGPTIALFGGFGGGSGMTNMGTSTIVNGDIGTTGTSTLITGFHDDTVMVGGLPQCIYTETGSNKGLVTGEIYTNTPPPTVGCTTEGTATTDATATQAALEAQTAYTTLKNLPPGVTLASNELGNTTLAPGTYTSSSFYDITAGDLTLDAKGDPNAFWIFQMGTYLTVGEAGNPRNVLLANGAQASNVFWQVGSAATINAAGGGTMVGTIISEAGISVSTAGNATVTTIDGRLLALTASTTLVNTVITLP
jgi:hypothetical protein